MLRHAKLSWAIAAALLSAATIRPANAQAPGAIWSDTDPSVNLTHIFQGEINAKGKPVGFHSRPHRIDPANARLVDVTRDPNARGVYEGRVEIRRGPASGWKEKRSTFFPDNMSDDEVTDAVVYAYNNRRSLSGNRFRGPSGPDEEFCIEGYLLAESGDINTAYPIYTMDRSRSKRSRPSHDDAGRPRPEASQLPARLAAFLDSDVQGDPDACREILDRLDPARGGNYERVGNAHVLTISGGRVTIEPLFEDGATTLELGAEELRRHLASYISSLESK